MYTLTFVHRAHSSGNQNIVAKSFDTLDNASNFLQDVWYDDQFEDWDEEDMGSKPTKDNFGIKELELVLGKRKSVTLYDPYSKYCSLVPDEVILSKE